MGNIFTRTRDSLRSNYLFLIQILIISILYFLYIVSSTRNVVFMDFWRYLVDIGEKVFNNTLTFSDIWKSYIGQRNPFLLFLFSLNLKFLKLNCSFECYAGILVNAASAIVLYKKFLIHCDITNTKKYYQLLFFPLLLLIFNLSRWEIITLQFSFAFNTRILLYLLVFIMFDNMMRYDVCSTSKSLLKGCFVGIVILFFSQLYFPAMVLSLITICSTELLLRFKEKNNKKLFSIISFFCPIIVSLILYFHGSKMNSSGGNFQYFISLVFNGKILIAISYMLTSCFIPQTIIAAWNSTLVLVIGFFFIFSICLSIFIYFYQKQFLKSWLPLLLIFYGIYSIAAIIYGRASFDLLYLNSSRYTVETNILWIGVLFIYMHSLLLNKNHKYLRYLVTFLSISLTFILVVSNIHEFNIGKYRGNYKDAILNNLEILQYKDTININEEFNEDFFIMCQAPSEIVKSGIILMKEKNLNIFNTSNKKEFYSVHNISSTDNWIMGDDCFITFLSKSTSIFLSFYNPSTDINGETVDIYLNNELVSQTLVKSGAWEIKVPIKSYKLHKLMIKTNYRQKITNGDIRELSLVLNDVKFAN